MNLKFLELELRIKELRETMKDILDKQISKLQTISFQDDTLPLLYINLIDFDIKSIIQKAQSHVNIQSLDLPTENLDLDKDIVEVIKRNKGLCKQGSSTCLTSFMASPLKRPRSGKQIDSIRSKLGGKSNIIDSMLTKHRELKKKLNSTSKSMEEVKEETSPESANPQKDLLEVENNDQKSILNSNKSTHLVKFSSSNIEEKKASLVNMMFKSKASTCQQLSPLFNQ